MVISIISDVPLGYDLKAAPRFGFIMKNFSNCDENRLDIAEELRKKLTEARA